jgi:hypothetical protein
MGTIVYSRYDEQIVRFEDFSLRKIAVGVSVLGLLNWAFVQFVALPFPSMGQQCPTIKKHKPDRKAHEGYTDEISVGVKRRPGIENLSLIVRHILCGLLMIAVIRLTWHI